MKTHRHTLAPALCFALALALGSVPGTTAAHPPALSASAATALQHFAKARAGEKNAIAPAVASFTELAGKHPEHPLYLAYQGSAIAMQAKDALAPWNKIRYAERGADLLEKAVALLGPEHAAPLLSEAPEALETRLVAANTLSSLPDMFNRLPAAKRISEALIKAPEFAAAPAPFRAQALAVAARIAGKEKRAADEASLLKQVLALDANGAAGQAASARLKELGQ